MFSLWLANNLFALLCFDYISSPLCLITLLSLSHLVEDSNSWDLILSKGHCLIRWSSVPQPVGRGPLGGLGALLVGRQTFLILLRINSSTIICYKYIKKQPNNHFNSIKDVKETQKVRKCGPPKCSYSSLVGRRGSNVENR